MSNPTGPSTPATSSTGVLTPAEQEAALRKVTWRLLPLLFLCYVIAYVDRINVGFAKLQLREVLGVDENIFSDIFGTGAGLFFIGYFIFEVPSNLILQRVGARVWIARIMIVWGLVSGAFMFMKGVTMFYAMRFLLGAAEAGFFPGVILYLTYWYPARERAKTIAVFVIGGVAAGVVGSPISGKLLELNGKFGLAGWQWLFLIEAIPALLMGFVILLALPNSPAQAAWLSDRERAWIQTRVREDVALTDPSVRHRLSDALTSGRVWLLCLIYFLMNIGGYGFEMWLPTIVKGLSDQRDFVVGLISAVPYLVAGVVMFLYGRHSDQTGERRGHIALAAAISAFGFVIAAYVKNPWIAIAGLTLAFAGQKSTISPFWAMATSFLTGTAAAGGIAFINSVGNLGGYVGPKLVGKLKTLTGSDQIPILVLGGALLGMSIFTLLVPKKSSPK